MLRVFPGCFPRSIGRTWSRVAAHCIMRQSGSLCPTSRNSLAEIPMRTTSTSGISVEFSKAVQSMKTVTISTGHSCRHIRSPYALRKNTRITTLSAGFLWAERGPEPTKASHSASPGSCLRRYAMALPGASKADSYRMPTSRNFPSATKTVRFACPRFEALMLIPYFACGVQPRPDLRER